VEQLPRGASTNVLRAGMVHLVLVGTAIRETTIGSDIKLYMRLEYCIIPEELHDEAILGDEVIGVERDDAGG